MYPRFIMKDVEAALDDTPVVLINGARQTGKTTLVRRLAEGHPAHYITLDDAALSAAALADPQGFILALPRPVIIDEVQHVPEIFRPIKLAVDRDRRPGSFILTGSANVLLLPRLSDSLAGRIEILTLRPLAQCEVEGNNTQFVDALFAKHLKHRSLACSRADVERRALTGGFPSAVNSQDDRRRTAWFDTYLTTMVQRDIEEMVQIEATSAVPKLLGLLAARTASLLNAADLSRDVALPYTTLSRYLALLQAAFLTENLSAWMENRGAHLVKAAKVHLTDTGLAAHLLHLRPHPGLPISLLLGPLLESFVLGELRAQASWSAERPRFYHYRTRTGMEVDIVMEGRAGRVVGVEVKSAGTITSSDFKGLRAFSEAVGERFVCGVVFYLGTETVPFGPNLWAVPVSSLWD